MRKILIILFLLLLFDLYPDALGETYYQTQFDMPNYYHMSARCSLARGAEPTAIHGDIKKYNLGPCPVCIPDSGKYPGIEACQRGGTVVLRVPDASVAKALKTDALPAFLSDELLHAEDRQEEDLARLVHGKAYLACLALAPGETRTVDAYIPEPQLGKGDLLMSRRHLGKAWYFVIRQNKASRKAMADSGVFEVSLRYWRVKLRVTAWSAGLTLEDAGDSACRDVSLRLQVKRSANKVVFDDQADPDFDQAVTVFQDRDVYTCVIHERVGGSRGIRRVWLHWAPDVPDWVELRGYLGKGEAIYCMVLTKGELKDMDEQWNPELAIEDPRASAAPPVDASEGAAPGHEPVTRTTLANGSVAEMVQAEYPIGTPFLRYRQLRPNGGIAFYEAFLRLERLAADGWRRVGNVMVQTGPNPGKGNRNCRSGWFCDEVQLVVPMEEVGALTEGLYRLRVSGGRGSEGGEWLEFTVKDGAPQPELPAAQEPNGPSIASHTPPYALPGYNSCQDTTRRWAEDHRQLLLVGDTVFDLREDCQNIEPEPIPTIDRLEYNDSNEDADEDWYTYDLFSYPLGHPEQARLVRQSLDMTCASVPIDGGSGLLLQSSADEERLYQLSYDGKTLEALDRFFQDDDQAVEGLLPVGDVAYFAAREYELWRTRLDVIHTEQVGRDPLKNNLWDPFTENYQPWSCLQYADGILMAANPNGILAINTLAKNADDHMPYKRLTMEYDYYEDTCGLGFIVLNGRLYCWSTEDQATISMKLDGSDRQVVSREHFYFSGVTPEGAVLAMTNLTHKGPFDGCESARLYLPDDSESPSFDPDHCKAYTLHTTGNAFLFGDYLWQIPTDGSPEILTLLSDILPD